MPQVSQLIDRFYLLTLMALNSEPYLMASIAQPFVRYESIEV